MDLDGSGLSAPLLAGLDTTLLKVSNVTGTITSPVLDTTGGLISTDFYFESFEAEQPGPVQNLEVIDSRFGSTAVLVNGAIWAVQSVEKDGRSAIRWFQIDEATHILLQSGLIEDDDLDLFYPSVAVNPFDDVVIGFNGSSEQQFVSSYAVAGETAAGVTMFGDLLLLEAGAASYVRLDGSGRNRWGDYSSTVVDPTDPHVFWTFQEVALHGNSVWGTQITQLFLPEPGAFLLVATGALALAVHVRRRMTPS